ncbi:MAG: BrxA family protein [Halomonas sp.]|uniref:BrxA family protein n=1 Tax=Halomonas sp. TaxID=1486246 RepID=UPI002ACE3015|nr:BrxA family protein [Halomonas sp.]MDZ7854169.1 BrxA family protein [Halomonas sp.]
MSQTRLYTTQLQAGLGLVEETQRLFELYEPGMRSPQLFAKALESGQFPLVSARRLDNIVRECFAPRYLRHPGVAEALKRLLPQLERDERLQVMLLHTARANTILADFIREVFWPRYSSGRDSVNRDDALQFVFEAVGEGKTQKPWSPSTISRVAGYLLSTCADFGLIEARRSGARRLYSVRLASRVAAYLAYDLKFQGLGDNQVLNHPDWQLFGLERSDVREQFKRLSLDGHLIMQAAGDVAHISWQYTNRQEVVDVLTGY